MGKILGELEPPLNNSFYLALTRELWTVLVQGMLLTGSFFSFCLGAGTLTAHGESFDTYSSGTEGWCSLNFLTASYEVGTIKAQRFFFLSLEFLFSYCRRGYVVFSSHWVFLSVWMRTNQKQSQRSMQFVAWQNHNSVIPSVGLTGVFGHSLQSEKCRYPADKSTVPHSLITAAVSS